jgi:hypothetical protein
MSGVTFCLTEMDPWSLGARGSEAGQMSLGERVLRSRRRMWLAAGVGVAAAAVAAWLSWPEPAVTPPARHYLDVTACLLTTSRGIAPGTPGAPAWKAMQTASLDTHVMVSYLPEPGPADSAVMLATLTERQCGVIIVAGPAPAEVLKAAKAHPHQRFMLVAAHGTAAAAVPSNTVVVSAASAPKRIDQALHALAAQTRVTA